MFSEEKEKAKWISQLNQERRKRENRKKNQKKTLIIDIEST